MAEEVGARSGDELKWRQQYLANATLDALDGVRRTSLRRPYVQSWMLAVQVLVLTAALLVFGMAPTTYKTVQEYASVDAANGGSTVVERNITGNVFGGVTRMRMVFLGAAYAPCMRREPDVMAHVAEIRAARAGEGCCTRQGGQFCYAAKESECGGTQTYHNNTECMGAICCVDPSDYPDCSKIPVASLPPGSEYDVCRCELAARPCCTSLQGDCEVLTAEHCDFIGGVFQEDAISCADVDCVDAACALGDFARKDYPDQWYRLLFVSFLPAGAIEIAYFGIVLIAYGLPLERVLGWWRYLLVIIGSGAIGHLVALILHPMQVSTGSGAAASGILGCHFAQLFASWSHLENPGRALALLLFHSLLTIALAVLPVVDLYACVAGFVHGVTLCFVLMPWGAFRSCDRAWRRVVKLFALIGVVFMYLIGISVFYGGEKLQCGKYCEQANCIDFVPGLCDFDLHEEL